SPFFIPLINRSTSAVLSLKLGLGTSGVIAFIQGVFSLLFFIIRVIRVIRGH
ncbi:MAG: hypothetical protein GY849_07095, partial [Deltaproteobacteria bacterium]|nr:hypothetical protein [Deltaproteobacteria bacterium]